MERFCLDFLPLQQYKEWLKEIVVWVADIHDKFLEYSKNLPSPLTDKDLHFLVIGAFGLAVFILSFFLFRLLSRLNRYGMMAWLFSFAVVLFVVFAIEVGQHLTKTGSLELGDIAYGVMGFLYASAGAAVLYLIFCLIRWLFRTK